MKNRTRNYATIVYPESAPDDWQEKIRDLHIPVLVSPVHDRDVDENGELKKPHYHCILMYSSLKTSEQARLAVNAFGGVGVEPIASLKSYVRYLTHMDDPDKVQYNPEDVIELSGADYNSLITLSSDKYTVIAEMLDYCLINMVESYAELLIYARHNRQDWFRALCDNATITMVQFLKSKTWERQRRMVDEKNSGQANRT